MRKKVTLKNVADAAEVSVITASRAIRGIGRVNPKTRQRILKASKQLGYTRQQGLIFQSSDPRNKAEHTLRILLPIFPFPAKAPALEIKTSRIIKELERTLERAEGVLTRVHVDNLEDLLNNLPRAKQHGIILRQILPKKWIDKLQQIAPIVYAISHDVSLGTDCIKFNEFKSTAMIYDHLLAHGHQNITWISHDRMGEHANVEFSLYDVNSGFDRQAYNFIWPRISSWAKLDIGTRDKHCRNKLSIIAKPCSEKEKMLTSKKLVQNMIHGKQRPTAIVTHSEDLAYSMTQALNEAGLRVPEDMSVVTYQEDTIPPPHGIDFTFISLPYEQVGKMILEIIQRRISSPEAPFISISIETQLVEGKTVAKAPVIAE